MTSIELHLPDEQASRLDSFARSARKTRDEATAQLLEEALRHEDFPAVEFRDSASGRQAYVVGSRLAVWEVLMVAVDHGLDAARTAAHLHWPLHRVEIALDYARQYPAEVQAALRENDLADEAALRRRLPNALWTD